MLRLIVAGELPHVAPLLASGYSLTKLDPFDSKNAFDYATLDRASAFGNPTETRAEYL